MLRLVAALLASFAMLLAVAAWLLSTGPVSLGFLTPYLKEALTLGQTDIRVELDDTILTWAGWDRTLDIRAIGVRLLNERGEAIAVIPEISLGLSGRAMLEKRVVPTTLDLLRPTLRFFRTRDGRLDLGFGANIGSTASDSALAFIEKLLNPSASDRRDGFLNRIRILDADVILVDRATKSTWRAPWADITLSRSASGLDGKIVADVEIGQATTRVTATGRYETRDGKLELEVLLADFEPSRLAVQVPKLELLKSFVAPISGTLAMTLFEDGRYSPLVFDLTGGPGVVSLPKFFPTKLVFSQLAVRGAVTDSFTALRVDELFVDAGGPFGTISGLATLDLKAENFGIGGTMEGEFQNVPIDDLKEYWPLGLAPAARNWVTTSLHGGRVTKGKVRLTVRPEDYANASLPDDAVSLAVEFEGVSANYLDGLPELVGASGTSRMTADVLDVAVTMGRTGSLELTEGQVHLDGLNGDAPAADIKFIASGPVAEGMKLLDMPPFEFAKLLDLDPATLSGQMAARAHFNFPLKETIAVEEIRFAAAANIREFAMTSGIGGFGLGGGSLITNIDANGMDVEGTVQVSGVPSTIKWRKKFHGAGAEISNLSVSLVLDEQGRKVFGLPKIPWLSGPIAVNGELLARGWQITGGELALNLTTATLDVPEIFWNKPSGTTANASLRFLLPHKDSGSSVGGNAATVNATATKATFSYAGGGLEAQGEIEAGSDGGFRRLDLSRLKFAQSEVAVSIRPLAPEGYIVALEGEQFDMRPYIDRLLGEAEQGELPPLTLTARLRRLILNDEHELANMQGRASYDGKVWQKMEASGDLRGGAPVNVALSAKDGKQVLSVTSTNGGAVARAMGIYDKAIGGELDVLATIHKGAEGNPVEGRVRMSKFRIVDAPTLAKILTVGSLTGVADVLSGQGVPFAQFQAPFRMLNDVIRIRGGRAIGPAFGITVDGAIDNNIEEVALSGTVVPAYTINSVLGAIPILGDILTGGKGGGVFGITYEVTGPISKPVIKVFPLSVLTPGVLRELLFGTSLPAEDNEEGTDNRN